MKKWAQRKSGFTIVELLIVVVVIAILASITIVSYSGIRQRAEESSAKSAVIRAFRLCLGIPTIAVRTATVRASRLQKILLFTMLQATTQLPRMVLAAK